MTRALIMFALVWVACTHQQPAPAPLSVEPSAAASPAPAALPDGGSPVDSGVPREADAGAR